MHKDLTAELYNLYDTRSLTLTNYNYAYWHLENEQGNELQMYQYAAVNDATTLASRLRTYTTSNLSVWIILQAQGRNVVCRTGSRDAITIVDFD